MRVIFAVNLGSRDAKQYGLDSSKCFIGETVDVPDEAAVWLKANGIALDPAEKKKQDQKVADEELEKLTAPPKK